MNSSNFSTQFFDTSSKSSSLDHPFFIYTNRHGNEKSNFIHKISEEVLVPAVNLSKNKIENSLKKLQTHLQKENFFYKKGFAQVNGIFISVLLLGKLETIENKQWILYSNPNGAAYEKSALRQIEFLKNLPFNCLFYNYPGVGESQGRPSISMMISTHEAMLKFLESEKNGIGAKIILIWGLSLGASLQTISMHSHPFISSVDYLAVQEQTFCKLSNFFPLLKLLKSSKLELDTLSSSLNLSIKELVIQRSLVELPKSKKDILSDGVINKKNALARGLLDYYSKHKTSEKSQVFSEKKFIYGVFTKHCESYNEETIKKIIDIIHCLAGKH